jgi:hypothetical protein
MQYHSQNFPVFPVVQKIKPRGALGERGKIWCPPQADGAFVVKFISFRLISLSIIKNVLVV